ncbi:MAG: hypothetical protein QM784_08225 [Polyangiaceae bacterium]
MAPSRWIELEVESKNAHGAYRRNRDEVSSAAHPEHFACAEREVSVRRGDVSGRRDVPGEDAERVRNRIESSIRRREVPAHRFGAGSVLARHRGRTSAALKVALWVTLFVSPTTALARPQFPAAIQDHLGLAQTPSCTLCHGSTAGGGPVVQPFGKAMLAAGLSGASSDQEVAAALDQLERDGTDSNGDGVSDIDSLKMEPALDPNPGGEPIKYGCGGQITRREPRGLAAWVIAVGVVVAVMGRNWARRGNASSRHSVRTRSAGTE